MATLKNVSLGLRGALLRNGERVWLEPGETLEVARAAVKLLPGGLEIEGAATVGPLDHDGDGKKGGSLKGKQSTAAKGRRRKSG